MSNIVLKVENLGKLYQIGEVSTGTLSQDLSRWWAKVRGEEDPFTLVGETNDRAVKGTSDFVWALKDINFEVKQGEILGIIGANGAGKSTLLKILSKITNPTKGSIKIKGRIASLLEVGTGFHPDLTGRENIFLNGAILGMTKAEIEVKLKEIINFAGVERYIDTPVKRYSSGMYVRLAFAVAAHLEPDILIIDEVLAVGDAEFQKKCLKKMKNVSEQDHRTVLFVSHNMQAISTLCTQAVWLEKGKVKLVGNAANVVNMYNSVAQQHVLKQRWELPEQAPGNAFIRILSIELIPHVQDPTMPLDIRTPFSLRYRFINYSNEISLTSCIQLYTIIGECIFDICSQQKLFQSGEMEVSWEIPGNLLNDGAYYFSINFVKDTTHILFSLEECIHFQLEDYRENTNYFEKWVGYIRPKLNHNIRTVYSHE